MKTAQLLQTLNDQLSELAALVAPLAEHATLSPRFDRQLFHTRSTLMQAYLAEAQHNFNQLRQAVERQQLPQVVWIAERLAAQIAALRRETATVLAQLGPRVANVEPLAAPSPAASGV
ncbi:hypothetical protein KPZU40_49350 [Klebsiella pneumoniae]|nr:hypothetical protein KPZU40_49350 [Klebsiella pneumoniae]